MTYRKKLIQDILIGLSLLTITCLTIASGEAQTLQVNINRWLEIIRLRGDVTYQSQEKRPAQVGDRLQAPGEGVITGNRSATILALDTEIGTVNVAEKTELRIKSLQITPNQGRVTLLSLLKGQARLRIRPFNNTESKLELETPAGVAGVRGTEFGVGVEPKGKTNIATLEGSVTATAQGQSVTLEKGYGSIIIPGEPPTPPQLITNDVSLRVIRLRRTSLGTVELKGQVDPFNLVWIDDEPVEVEKNGKIRVITPLSSSYTVRVRVQSPLGNERTYSLLVR